MTISNSDILNTSQLSSLVHTKPFPWKNKQPLHAHFGVTGKAPFDSTPYASCTTALDYVDWIWHRLVCLLQDSVKDLDRRKQIQTE